MTLDLIGRAQTRIVVGGVLVPALLAALAPPLGLGGTACAAPVFALYGFVLGLAAEPLYALAQRLRREGDWPPAHVVYGLLLEVGAVFAAMRAGILPGLPACLETAQDLALRRTVCALPALSDGETVLLFVAMAAITLGARGVILPILLPRWRLNGGRIVTRGGR